ncbi:MAG: hypothetical protein L6437_05170 [Kiritimatiellae bacterium]|nr:hypothetical protein [Pseudomonadota bacterium]MCG2659620.1 hypothetical protein [Kiritimatiellia bacterium]
MKKIYSAVFIVLLISSAVKAGISMDDRWREDGVLIAKGENWEARFSKKEKGMVLRVWREDVEQSIMIIPFVRDNLTVAEGIADLKLQAGEEKKIVVDATFHGGGKEIKGRFSFDDSGIAEITPLENMEGVCMEGDIRYGLLPGLFLEDVGYDPEKEAGLSEIYVPSENCIAGFLGDGNGILVCTWPEGSQQAKILLGKKDGKNYIRGMDVILDGKNIYAGLMTEKGIWYQALFPDESRGKDIKIPWKRPFNAKVKWKTQMLVAEIETSFLFDNKKRESKVYYPGAGRVIYPLWFNEDGEAFSRFNEKIFPKEKRAFIYPFEGHPETLMGFLNRTPMGNHFSQLMKKSWPFEPPAGVSGVGFTACWGTDLLRTTIMKAGIQDREQVFLNEWIKSVLMCNEGTQNRRENYGKLINGINEKITLWIDNEKSPDALKFLEEMKGMALKVKKAYNAMIKADGYNSPAEYVAHAEELGERLREIIPCPRTEFFPEYDHLIGRLNSVTWGQQETTGRFGWCLREWFLMAGYDCRNNPEAIKYAEEIRKDIRNFLRARSWETTGL